MIVLRDRATKQRGGEVETGRDKRRDRTEARGEAVPIHGDHAGSKATRQSCSWEQIQWIAL